MALTLRETRELLKTSQRQLAEAAGCGSQDISDLERGINRKPSHELVMRIVSALRQLGLPGLVPEGIAEFAVPSPATSESTEKAS